MSPHDSVAQETKWLQMRSCHRVNSRIPVRLEWTEASDHHLADGYTMDVCRQGCLLISAREFALNQRIRLTNLATQQTVNGIMVWKGPNAHPGWELGVELLNPPYDFWGLEI